MSAEPGPDVRATIVVVGYNHGRFIEQCLESVRGQSEPCALIVLDDASTDDTVAKAHAFAERTGFEFTIVENRTNRGLGAMLVDGLARVTTPYFAYLAADDWMEPDRVAIQATAMEQAGPTCALSYTDSLRADVDGNPIEPTLSVGMGAAWQPENPDPFRALLRDNWIPAPTVMIRTEALRSVGGYDPEIFYEDHDVALRLARHFKVLYIDRPLATHREIDGSLGNRMFFHAEHRPEWTRARLLIYRKHLGYDAEVDALIAPLMATWLRDVYLAGNADPAWVRATAAEINRHLPDGRSLGSVLTLARLGVPGSIARRALSRG